MHFSFLTPAQLEIPQLLLCVFTAPSWSLSSALIENASIALSTSEFIQEYMSLPIILSP